MKSNFPSAKYEYSHRYLALFPKSDEVDLLEYISNSLTELLNEFSADGWELVQISESLLNGNTVDGCAIFRRQVQ